MKNKYGIQSLKKQFPNEETCVEFIFDTLHSRDCSCGGKYSLIKGRRQLQCSKCRFQIAPTASTIFHKSPTPINLWFYAILMFSNAKSGVSAKELSRQLEVTYKCAWRMLNLIKQALRQDTMKKLRGDVEIDVGFMGGKGYGGKNNEKLGEAMARKSIIAVAVERGGRMVAEIIPSTGSQAMQEFVERNIETKATTLYTDNADSYKRLDKTYDRASVTHKRREWVRGDVHVNSVETFFAHLKRSVRGTFKSISKQHLQTYLDAFVWHYNNRHSDKARFEALLGALLQPVK
ncbi:MAG: IS1595 family transposase [bacterium]|nr:IS1595 family transposase [bacterium]